ncbi:glycosyltransferase family A protein [Microbacterium sp.]|uniref:glycosyltransferase family A protein n=1 Tax=Microbacterium sp. TaxID=51671 RepID=UPI003341C12D
MSASPDGVQIDVLVPIHAPTRPIARLVHSVLDGVVAPVRVLVVAHDTDPRAIAAAMGELADDPRVEIVPFEDGIRSPAGPLLHGLSLVSAPWFAKIDSDDFLAPGALDSWLRVAQEHGADAVIPRMVTEHGGRNFPTPPRRPFRRRLDPVRDRLSYRTSTMGLLSARLRDAAAPSAGVPTGEDVLPSLRLWFGATRVVGADDAAAYVVGETAGDRVTESAVPLQSQLEFVAGLLDDPIWQGLSQRAAEAIVRKVLRVHVLGALALAPDLYREVDREPVAEIVRALGDRAPGAVSALSRADAALVAVLAQGEAPPETVRRLAVARRRRLRPAGLLPARLGQLFSRDAPPRFLVASVLALRRGGGVPKGAGGPPDKIDG